MTSPVTPADWAKEMNDIEGDCDDLETCGIEVVRLAALLELVSDDATQFPELLSPGAKDKWGHVVYLTGLLRKVGEEIEASSGKTMKRAAALSEFARKGSAATHSNGSNAKTEDGQ